MKKASIRDAVKDAARVIQGRGEQVAELQAVKKRHRRKLPGMTRLWNDFPELPGDSTRFIDDDRDR